MILGARWGAQDDVIMKEKFTKICFDPFIPLHYPTILNFETLGKMQHRNCHVIRRLTQHTRQVLFSEIKCVFAIF